MLHYLHVAATIAGLTLQAFGYAEGKSLKGQIMSVTESQVMLQQGTETVTLFVSKDTKVSLNGKDSKLSDLKMSDMAEVSAEENGDRTFKALTIKATRSEKQPAVPR
jgi:hypothetical protein